ncbi:MAG TPA: hypothetical protein VMM13_05500 [Euzebya sp.]|nr:hypothetical protein [Euzebya sp.]
MNSMSNRWLESMATSTTGAAARQRARGVVVLFLLNLVYEVRP